MVKSAGTQIHWRIVMKSETLRRMWALCAGALIFAAGSSARAQDGGGKMACVNDPDCPTATCGGDVCQYGAVGQFCVPAGTDKKGHDGWCTTDDDCKCKSLGAKCVAAFCSFTLPKDAPAGAGTGGAGGSSATGSGGDATGTAGAGTAPAAASDSGGCAIASTPAAGIGSAGLLVGLGAIAFGARRRRRAA